MKQLKQLKSPEKLRQDIWVQSTCFEWSFFLENYQDTLNAFQSKRNCCGYPSDTITLMDKCWYNNNLTPDIINKHLHTKVMKSDSTINNERKTFPSQKNF